jgi:hypothetical protein
MTNSLVDVVRLHYAEATQENLEKSLTSMDLAGMIDIPNGTTKNLPYLKMRATGNYTKYTNQTIQDVTTGNDTIVINTTPMVTFAMDVIDEGDDYIDIKPEVIQESGYQIKKRIDGDFFNQVLNAKWKYDTAGFGRNNVTLSPITLTTGASQNISATFGRAKAGLVNNGATGTALKLCVDDFITADLTTLGMETNVVSVADVSYTRGFQGRFGGMDTYAVSMLTSSATFALSVQPTDGDTVQFQGVTFTFKTTLGATAGQVLIGASAATANTNLAALINNPGTTTANGVALDSDDIAIIEAVSAVAGATSTTITSKNGAIMGSQVMASGSNKFGAQVVNACIIEKGAIKMAIRNGVKVETRDEPLKLVTNYFIYARYGLKVTTRSKERMCVIPLVTQAAF